MKVTILGTGAYGIALAKVLNSNKNKVKMWTKFQEEVDTLNLNRENTRLLPGIKIDENIIISSDLENSVKNADVIIVAVPMNAVREVSTSLNNYLKQDQIICIVTKGIEIETGKRMSEIVYEQTNSNNICMLSGPSFAIEVASDNKLGLVSSSNNLEIANIIKSIIENDNINVTVISDIIGVEVCSAAKNAMAIIMGIIDKESDSTKATMLTNLLNDLRLICEIMGGKSQTIFTYAGIGDFLLTCMNNKSRNYTFGTLIMQGNSIKEAFDVMNISTVEGLYSLDAIYNILIDKQISIKSIDILYNILHNGEDIESIFECLK